MKSHHAQKYPKRQLSKILLPQTLHMVNLLTE